VGRAGRFTGTVQHASQYRCRCERPLYVADRGNRRIQVFGSEGKSVRQITIDVPFDSNLSPAIGNKPVLPIKGPQTMAPGSPWAICITPPPNQVLFSSDAYPGRIYKLSLDGEVLGMLGQSGKQLKQFGWIHEIACPSDHELYVSELLNWRVQKLVLKARHEAVSKQALPKNPAAFRTATH
jgi:hypothetical protein